jgi:quercetin dioxygenase-like cupin family protein
MLHKHTSSLLTLLIHSPVHEQKEKPMPRLTLILAVALLYVAGVSSAQHQVDRKGTTSTVKLEQVVSGHLTDLNGKYKLQVTEITYEPGGYTGEHHHVGPGIRFVAAGELTFVQEGKTVTYKTGEYFYEAGDITNAAYNRSNAPVRIINFEILPADWKGGSAVPPKSR